MNGLRGNAALKGQPHCAALAVTAMVLSLTAACAVASASPQAASSAAPPSPGGAALHYISDLFSGNASAAIALVLPADRPALRMIAADIKPRSVKSGNLAIGSTSISGQHATVILTGTFCTSNRTQSTSGVSGSHDPCYTNSGRDSANPIFTVLLTEQDGGWFVYYPAPTSTAGSPQPARSASARN